MVPRQCCFYGTTAAGLFLAYAAPLRYQILGILLPPARMPHLADLEAEKREVLKEAGLLSLACGLAASFCVALGGLFGSNFYNTLRNRTSIESRRGANGHDLGLQGSAEPQSRFNAFEAT